MTTVRDIYNALFAFAPASMKMDWDNVGLLCGRFDAPVDTVLVALDPMPDVIDEAKKTGAQCIVTHHPLFFDAPRAVNDASYKGRCILELAEAKIAAINLHTNLDVCPGGVNDVLAETLGLTEVSVLNQPEQMHGAGLTASSAPARCGSSVLPNLPRLSNRHSPAPDSGLRTRENPCGAWLSAAGAAAARLTTCWPQAAIRS